MKAFIIYTKHILDADIQYELNQLKRFMSSAR